MTKEAMDSPDKSDATAPTISGLLEMLENLCKKRDEINTAISRTKSAIKKQVAAR